MSRVLMKPHPVAYDDLTVPEGEDPVAARLRLHLECDHGEHPLGYTVEAEGRSGMASLHEFLHVTVEGELRPWLAEETREFLLWRAAERVVRLHDAAAAHTYGSAIKHEAITKLAAAVRRYRAHDDYGVPYVPDGAA